MKTLQEVINELGLDVSCQTIMNEVEDALKSESGKERLVKIENLYKKYNQFVVRLAVRQYRLGSYEKCN